MKKLLIILLLAFCSPTLWAQEDDKVYTIVEVMPEYVRGEDAMNMYIGTHIEYPEEAIKKGVTGVVYVNFVVNKEGFIRKTKVLRGIGSGCDEEALRVVNSMPRWKPATHKGEAKNVSLTLPIRFNLDKKGDDGKKSKKAKE